MVQAITSSAGAPAAKATDAGAAATAASLEAQLQRFQQQLSDCVNCDTAKTPQGKADIAAVTARISAVRQHIAAAGGIGGAGSTPPAQPVQAAQPADPTQTADSTQTAGAVAAAGAAAGTVGSRIDVFT